MDFKDIKDTRHYLYDDLGEFQAFVQDTAIVDEWGEMHTRNLTLMQKVNHISNTEQVVY
jgi:hypothetical protein